MMKMSYVLIVVFGASLLFAGCSEIETEKLPVPSQQLSETNTSSKEPLETKKDEIVSSVLHSSVKVDNVGTDTTVNYTFKNISKEPIVIVGGARYTLLKDKKEVEKGGVPVKDYIDLKPGEEYKASKTFKNLQPGSYTIQVEWNKTVVTSEFIRN